MTPSRVIVKDSFPQKFANINGHSYVLHQYYTYSEIRSTGGYPNRDSILVYREITPRKYQTRFLGYFPAQSSPSIFLQCLS